MSTSMDTFLAEHYGTNKTASAPEEDLEKQASVELFLKLASDQKIDIKAMSDVQVEELYNNWVKAASAPAATTVAEKTAEEKEEEEEEKKKEKLEEAEKEHEEKKAAAEKVAEADFMGRVMAHAYVNELKKIAAAAPVEVETATKEAGRAKEIVDTLKQTAHPGKTLAHAGAKGLAGAAAIGGAAFGAKKLHDKYKKASAIDELAYVRAQELAKEAGFDHEEAASKIAAAFTLNLVEESTKTASAPDVETAVGIRALELLEKVGYPVEWTK